MSAPLTPADIYAMSDEEHRRGARAMAPKMSTIRRKAKAKGLTASLSYGSVGHGGESWIAWETCRVYRDGTRLATFYSPVDVIAFIEEQS